MRCGTAGLGLLVVVFTFLLVLEPLPVHAASTLIQQNSAGCIETFTQCSTDLGLVHVPFLSGLTAGNIVVVGIALTPVGVNGLTSIGDSKGFSYTLAASVCVGLCAYIYYAVISSGGADTVTVSVSGHVDGGENGGVDVYIYEVSGITASGLAMSTGQGSGSGTQSVSTSSSVSFSSGAFLLGVISNSYNESAFSAGGGFIPSTQNSRSGDGWAEYSDPASSPTNFPATIGTGVTRSWVEAGVLFPASSAPPVPEYPLGLPILAVLAIVGYGLVRQKVGKRPSNVSIGR